MTTRYSEQSKAIKQASRAANSLARIGEARHSADKNDGYVRSLGTKRSHEECFKVCSQWCEEQDDIKRFNAITPAQAERWLQEKSVDVTDKTLAGYAVSMEHHLKNNCGHDAVKLERPVSEIPAIQQSRAYTKEAIDFLQTQQTERAALATKICAEAGLRAHELFTLQRRDERDPSARRAWRDDRFAGRDNWVVYTVDGKGGLVREVAISPETSAALEAVRLDEPRLVIDRDIRYHTRYDLMGGKSFSNSFSKLSINQLGHSFGAHGMRHTYAQDRMKELGNSGKSYDDCKLIVSQELGHFRPSITDIYLR